ncbi:MAG: response regulator, partial [Burkholderiales bacterium]
MDLHFPAEPSRTPRILVADDNRDTVLSVTLLLRNEGYEVRGVYSGSDVLRIARLHRFDAIILDIEMPEISGYAVAQELRMHYYG